MSSGNKAGHGFQTAEKEVTIVFDFVVQKSNKVALTFRPVPVLETSSRNNKDVDAIADSTGFDFDHRGFDVVVSRPLGRGLTQFLQER